MKKFLFLIPLIYFFFAITADFQVLKRDFSLAEEATYLLAQINFCKEVTPKGLNHLRTFYPKGGRIALVWRGKPYPYSPWIYNVLVRPFYLLFGERGLYIFNSIFILLGLYILLILFRENTWAFLALLASTFPLFVLLEGPYAIGFFLASITLYGILKENPWIVGVFSGILAFLFPLFFFLVPLLVLVSSRKPLLSSAIAFSAFFLLVLGGFFLGGNLPWEIPFMAGSLSDAAEFLLNPIIASHWKFAGFNFLFGRFTGALLYFPVLFLLWPEREELGYFLFGILLLIVFLFLSPAHAPFGFVGNPWVFPAVVFTLPFTRRFLSRAWILFSILMLSIVLLLPLRSLSNPLLHGSNFPFVLFPPETNILESLPAVKIGQNYHFDLNFYAYRGNSFRPKGKSRVEFIRIDKSSSINLLVKNLADTNSFYLKVNGSKRVLKLDKGESFIGTFNGIKFGENYLYRIIFKSKQCRVYLPSKICLGAQLEWR